MVGASEGIGPGVDAKSNRAGPHMPVGVIAGNRNKRPRLAVGSFRRVDHVSADRGSLVSRVTWHSEERDVIAGGLDPEPLLRSRRASAQKTEAAQ